MVLDAETFLSVVRQKVLEHGRKEGFLRGGDGAPAPLAPAGAGGAGRGAAGAAPAGGEGGSV